MKNPVFIFDFDGTIADTHRYIVKISNRLSKEFNYNTISLEEIELLKDKTAQEIINHLKVPILKIPAILARAKKEFHKEVASLKPFHGLKEMLKNLQKSGIAMGILSSNSYQNILKFLNNHDLNIFEFIHSSPMVMSKNKCLKKLMEEKNFSDKQILYIGDEVRDITAARKLGIKIAAVTWGYNSSKILREHQPDYIISKPDDLIQLYKALRK